MKKVITIFIVSLLAGQAMAKDDFDFSAECTNGQTLYYKITSNTFIIKYQFL